MANLSRQWKVAELLRRSSDTLPAGVLSMTADRWTGQFTPLLCRGGLCRTARDPNEWNDEQWLEWLKATDDAPFDDSEESISGSDANSPVNAWSGHRAGDARHGAGDLRRQNDEVVVVVEDNGETTDDKPFAVRLDFDHPERSLVEFKPAQTPRPENGESGSRRYWVCRVCTRRQYSVLDPAPRCTFGVPTNLRSIAVGE